MPLHKFRAHFPVDLYEQAAPLVIEDEEEVQGDGTLVQLAKHPVVRKYFKAAGLLKRSDNEDEAPEVLLETIHVTLIKLAEQTRGRSCRRSTPVRARASSPPCS